MNLRYTVPDDFNVEAFEDACAAQGVILEGGGPLPDGYLILSGLNLTVTLYQDDSAKAAIVTAQVEAQGGHPA